MGWIGATGMLAAKVDLPAALVRYWKIRLPRPEGKTAGQDMKFVSRPIDQTRSKPATPLSAAIGYADFEPRDCSRHAHANSKMTIVGYSHVSRFLSASHCNIQALPSRGRHSQMPITKKAMLANDKPTAAVTANMVHRPCLRRSTFTCPVRHRATMTNPRAYKLSIADRYVLGRRTSPACHRCQMLQTRLQIGTFCLRPLRLSLSKPVELGCAREI